MALNIIFMGTPDFAVQILSKIHNSKHKILHVYTQSPKKKNRGQKTNISPVHEYCKKNQINVRHPEELDSNQELDFFTEKKIDVVVVVAYGKILPAKLLNLKNINFLNVHASLLPKWRGAAPIQRSIMNLDKETGVSIMKIIPKLDAGPIIIKSKVKITKDTNSEVLSKELSSLGAKLILDGLDLVENNKVKFIEQDETEATYAKKIDKIESKINWSEKAKIVIAKINAFYPKPGSWFEHKGIRLKINKAIEVSANGNPGEIIDNQLTIACGENAIQILDLQKEGKKNMTVSEFLKGNKLEIGSNVS